MTRASRDEQTLYRDPEFRRDVFTCVAIVVAVLVLVFGAKWARADAVSDLKAFPTAKLPAVAVWSDYIRSDH